MSSKSSQSKTRSTRLFYAIHKWTGLISGINVLIFSLTAAYLLGEGIVHEWQHKHDETGTDARVLDHSLRQPLQPIADKIIARYPDEEVTLARAEFAFLEGQPDKLAFSGPDGYFRYAIDPDTHALSVDYGTPPVATAPNADADGLTFATTGDEVEEHGMSPLGQWMLALHANLLLGTLGTVITGIIGILFLVSTVTGFIIYAPFMKALAFGKLRRGPKVHHPAADIHKVVGIATLAFNGMMALTGIGLTLGIFAIQFYLLFELKDFEKDGDTIVVSDLPPSIDAIFAEGRKVLPETSIYRIDCPGGIQGDQSYAVYAHEDPRSRGLIPTVAAVTAESTPRSLRFVMPLWIKVIVIGIPIHVASFGGNFVRVVYILLALSSGLLSVTGFVMYFSKRFRRRKASKTSTSRVTELETNGMRGIEQSVARTTGAE